jgi:hypothetical protein
MPRLLTEGTKQKEVDSLFPGDTERTICSTASHDGREEGPMKNMLEILDEIEHYIQRTGEPYNALHVVVTTDVEKSFGEHDLKRGDPHIHAEAESPAGARNIMRFLIYRGMTGDLEHYDNNAQIVYVFKKSGITGP